MHAVRKLLEIKAQKGDTVATAATAVRAAMMVEAIAFVGI